MSVMRDILRDFDLDDHHDIRYAALLCVGNVHALASEWALRLRFGPGVASLVSLTVTAVDARRGSAACDEWVDEWIDEWSVAAVVLTLRLLNMHSTIGPDRARDMMDLARETEKVYVPLARRFGFVRIQDRLGDTSLYHLNRKMYEVLLRSMSVTFSRSEEALQRAHHRAIDAFPQCDVSVRTKAVHSTYRKMLKYDIEFDEVHDLLAMRVIVNTNDEGECRRTLRRVCSIWSVVAGTIKDYVSHPKPNGYRSIHVVILDQGVAIEVQIRTPQMHEVAERGSAAHWRYKDPCVYLPLALSPHPHSSEAPL